MATGRLKKLDGQCDDKGNVSYQLHLGDTSIGLNDLLGQRMLLEFTGEIHCVACQRKIKKPFNGYCYPCFRTLPQADMCMVKPEACHFHLGTCRDGEWGTSHCFIDHTVYLANSSGLKVGITRSYRKLTRWIDQGASEAIVLLQTKKRLQAGKVEVFLKQYFADKTNWRKMLKGTAESRDLIQDKKNVTETLLTQFKEIEMVDDTLWQLSYPVLQYPEKVTSLNLVKETSVTSCLMGIKGQYLILEKGVLNMRKLQGHGLFVSY